MLAGQNQTLRANEDFGPFRLLRRLGIGGTAEVWLAETQSAAPRKFALKVFDPQLAVNPTLNTMFQDECRIAATLQHPNIARSFGAQQIEGRHVLVMEYLVGFDLWHVTQKSTALAILLPLEMILAVAYQAACALSYAHTLTDANGRCYGLIHRDISPHNLFVTEGGQLKVLDFGIAWALERLTQTKTGIVKGKLAYMAPEQALGLVLTPRVDVFALGVVLWEMLAGRRLYTATTDEALYREVVKADVPALSPFRAQIPHQVSTLLEHMLQRRPEQRLASMSEVVKQLDALTDGKRVTWPAWIATRQDAQGQVVRPRQTRLMPVADAVTPAADLQIPTRSTDIALSARALLPSNHLSWPSTFERKHLLLFGLLIAAFVLVWFLARE